MPDNFEPARDYLRRRVIQARDWAERGFPGAAFDSFRASIGGRLWTIRPLRYVEFPGIKQAKGVRFVATRDEHPAEAAYLDVLPAPDISGKPPWVKVKVVDLNDSEKIRSAHDLIAAGVGNNNCNDEIAIDEFFKTYLRKSFAKPKKAIIPEFLFPYPDARAECRPVTRSSDLPTNSGLTAHRDADESRAINSSSADAVVTWQAGEAFFDLEDKSAFCDPNRIAKHFGFPYQHVFSIALRFENGAYTVPNVHDSTLRSHYLGDLAAIRWLKGRYPDAWIWDERYEIQTNLDGLHDGGRRLAQQEFIRTFGQEPLRRLKDDLLANGVDRPELKGRGKPDIVAYVPGINAWHVYEVKRADTGDKLSEEQRRWLTVMTRHFDFVCELTLRNHAR